MMMSRRNPPEVRPHPDVSGSASHPGRNGGGAARAQNEKSEVHGVSLPKILTDGNPDSVNVIDETPEAESYVAVGARLRLFRRAMGLGSVAEAARSIACERTRWANWEAGFSYIPAQMAARLRRNVPALCLNWLYMGDIAAMSVATANALRAQEARDRDESVARKRGQQAK